MNELVYTAKQVMELFHIKSYQVLVKWKNEGLLRPLNTPTKKLLYSKSEVKRFLRQCGFDNTDD